ncbi:MAG: class I SAM-dependent methyltransferase [Gemmatimonadota bacterium]
MILPASTPTHPGTVAAHYDTLDRYYRELWGEHVHHGLWERGDETPEEAVVALVHLVAEMAALDPGDRVCDVGCGYGGTARILAGAYGVRVEGVTVSPEQYRRALAHEREARGGGVLTRPAVRYHLRDWMETRLPRETFHAVVAVESMTHMPSLQGAVDRIWRVLRPGGRFVACVWLAREGVGAPARKHLLEPICREGRLTGLPTAREFRRTLVRAGFAPGVVATDLSRYVRRTWSVTVARGLRRLVSDREARRFLLDPEQPDRIFAATMVRIWLAFHTGAMRYGIFTATRPPGSGTHTPS